jgi:predicted nucleic acid-binding protein
MFVVDTNVVSELRKTRLKRADPSVVAWVRTVLPDDLYFSAISLMELEIGVLLTERRDARQGKILRAWLNQEIRSSFAGRILPIDDRVATRCAALHIPNRKPDRDALLAATALVHGMTVVTRNEKDFTASGVAVLNPWKF